LASALTFGSARAGGWVAIAFGATGGLLILALLVDLVRDRGAQAE
jgi:hypothetical protein